MCKVLSIGTGTQKILQNGKYCLFQDIFPPCFQHPNKGSWVPHLILNDTGKPYINNLFTHSEVCVYQLKSSPQEAKQNTLSKSKPESKTLLAAAQFSLEAWLENAVLGQTVRRTCSPSTSLDTTGLILVSGHTLRLHYLRLQQNQRHCAAQSIVSSAFRRHLGNRCRHLPWRCC